MPYGSPTGASCRATVTIWTAGFGVPDLAARSGLRTDALGRLLTDETLTSVDDERIVAAGDSAAPSDLPFRMSCQAAVQLGPQAAETVLSRIAGERPQPSSVGFVGSASAWAVAPASFSSCAGTTPRSGTTSAAGSGAKVKELICRSIPWQLAYEARKPGARTWWSKDAKRGQLLRAAAEQERATTEPAA